MRRLHNTSTSTLRTLSRCAIALTMWLPATLMAGETYAEMLESLRAGITGKLPRIAERRIFA